MSRKVDISPIDTLQKISHIFNEYLFTSELVEKWERIKAARWRLLVECKSVEAFGIRVNALIDELGISHTGYLTKASPNFYHLLDLYQTTSKERVKRICGSPNVEYAGIAIEMRQLDRQWFVAYVLDGGPAQVAGIKAGDELVTANGQAFHPIDAFAFQEGQIVELQIRRRKGAPPLGIAVVPKRIRPRLMFRAATLASVQTFEDKAAPIGYLRLWSYLSMADHNVLMRQLGYGPLSTCGSLILDLRGGVGGTPPDAVELFAGLGPTLHFIDRQGRSRLSHYRWNKTLVAVVNGDTRSGKEVLAYGLQKRGITLIGSRTAGAVLGARVFLLDDQSLLTVATHDVLVDGQRLEGRGIEPDIVAKLQVKYASGRDKQLAAAIKCLRQQT